MTGGTLPKSGLPALAAGLCQDPEISVLIGRSWRFDPRRRTIEVARRHLEPPSNELGGLLAHESGHVWLSRYHMFEQRGLSPKVWGRVMNILEDPRVNCWMRSRYPGTEPWFRAMFAADRKTRVTTPSRFLLWGAAASIADAYDWHGPPAWIVGQPHVLRAFRRTASGRRRYALEVPPADLGGAPTPRDFARIVRPRLRSDQTRDWPDAPESTVLVSAARALAIAERSVFPAVRILLEQDKAAIEAHFEAQPEAAQLISQGLEKGDPKALAEIHRALKAAPRSTAAEGCPETAALAERARDWYLTQVIDGVDLKPVTPSAVPTFLRRMRRGDRVRRRRLDKAKVMATVKRQVPHLVRDMESSLAPAARSKLRPGYASGPRLDPRRAMAFDAVRRGHDQLWCRRQAFDGPRGVVSLLVDLSGSMNGGKIEAAIIGTLLLAESLERLAPAVRFAVNGFQDELIPVIKFGEPLSPARREAIFAMALEVAGARPGGHNKPRFNDDAPCLEEAAEQLRREQGQRLLMVVSDGRPSGRRSNEKDLHQVVARLTRPGAGLTLFGLGLGPGTGHVDELYPNSIADIPVEHFAERIGRLVKQVLRRAL